MTTNSRLAWEELAKSYLKTENGKGLGTVAQWLCLPSMGEALGLLPNPTLSKDHTSCWHQDPHCQLRKRLGWQFLFQSRETPPSWMPRNEVSIFRTSS